VPEELNTHRAWTQAIKRQSTPKNVQDLTVLTSTLRDFVNATERKNKLGHQADFFRRAHIKK
jgi:hypothetical protein